MLHLYLTVFEYVFVVPLLLISPNYTTGRLHKDTTWFSALILDKALYNKSAIRPRPAHLRNHPKRMNKIFWAFLEK